MEIDLFTARDFAIRLAAAAAAVAMKYFGARLDIESKGDHSPVTIADRQAEQVVRDLIAKTYPEHGVLGEELGQHHTEAEYVWVIDPIDGTASFVTGKPLFGTLISLLHEGTPIIGVIHMPALGQRWTGCRGHPTAFDEIDAATRPCAELKEAWLSATSPQIFAPDDFLKFEALRKRCRATVYGSDCYAYGLLANGNLDLVVESSMGIYDFCALAPVIAGAGGVITDWRGKELSIHSDGRVVAAGDRRLHRAALDILSG